MYYIVINKRRAGKDAIERLNREIEKGTETIAKVEIKGQTMYILTKAYLEQN